MPQIDPTRVQPVVLVDPSTGIELGDGPDPFPTTDTPLTLRIEPNAANNPVYVGRAQPGADPSQPVWRIRNFTYDANNNIVSSGYPNGSPSYSFVWNNRATYTYS